MAHPSLVLISSLRKAARNLRQGALYAWGHHGACNCGQLLQVLTHWSREEILRWAQTGSGEWTELAAEYCGVTRVPADFLVYGLEAIGLTPTDIHCLEYLSDPAVLQQLPGGFRWLQKNKKEDVILYFETMAALLEDQLTPSLSPVSPKKSPSMAGPVLQVL
ncbi:MAG: hypothetical protein ACXVBI_04180 [Flavisolibacter sp.]